MTNKIELVFSDGELYLIDTIEKNVVVKRIKTEVVSNDFKDYVIKKHKVISHT